MSQDTTKLKAFSEDESTPITLHENVQKRLNTTPGGKIYDSQLTDIYSLLIICLNLTEKRVPEKRYAAFSRHHYPYSFHLSDAIKAMQNLKVTVKSSTASTSISYKINPELGKTLMKRFYEGKLLHSPADRTRRELKDGVALQPTPKGVCILQTFLEKVGMFQNDFPPIVLSRFNSMYSLRLERDASSDRIVYSKYFIILIFILLAGKEPNVWSSEKKPDLIPSIDKKLKTTIITASRDDDANNIKSSKSSKLQSTSEDTSGAESYASRLKDYYNISDKGEIGFVHEPSTPKAMPATHSSSTFASSTENYPFYHKYFTNPESDSHVQYYTSSSGVRVFLNKVFYSESGSSEIIPSCISGKAITQWICDCTDVLTLSQAVSIGNLILSTRLIEPIQLKGSLSNYERFSSDRNAFYKLSQLGERVCHWDFNGDPSQPDSSEQLLFTTLDEDHNPDSETLVPSRDNSIFSTYTPHTSITLPIVLNDSGLRFLFKEHLELELCSENLQVYLLIHQFHDKMKTLKAVSALSERANGSSEKSIQLHNKITSSMKRMKSDISSLAYHIYFKFLATNAPNLLNVNSSMRDDISKIMDKGKLDDNKSVSKPGDLDPIVNDLSFLAEISESLGEIQKSVYRMMEIDSLPKFLETRSIKTLCSH